VHPSHFFKYYTADVAKIVLRTGRVRLSSPTLFNDPFDCYFSLEPKFDFDAHREKFCDRFVEVMFQEQEPAFAPDYRLTPQLQAFRNAARHIGREKVREAFGATYAEMVHNIKLISEQAREAWTKERRDYRLFCVCEGKDNLQLWSHYTASHTGAAFQFECIEDLDSPWLAAKRVAYSEEAPSMATEEQWTDGMLGLLPLEFNDDLWTRLVTTKARVWEYEKEWRVIFVRRPDENQGYEDTEFYPREISKVFLGCRMTESDRNEMVQLIDGSFSHVEVYQAKQNPVMYRLDFDRVK
jgi:hypothetical protein